MCEGQLWVCGCGGKEEKKGKNSRGEKRKKEERYCED